MDTIRQNKISRLIQKELSEIIRIESISRYDKSTIITITNVRVTADLSIAKVYISIFSSKIDKKTIFEDIDNSNKFFRLQLGKIIGKQVRIIPELRFYIDDSLDYVERIEQLLK